MTGEFAVRRVLAIGAHPDDCELLCGGTLAKYRARGVEVGLCAIARGDKGSKDLPRDELAVRRSAESARAASVISATCHNLAVADCEVQNSLELRDQLLKTIRQFQPDVIITHWPGDYHADHCATAELVTDCSWFAASSGHITSDPTLDAPVPVMYMDTVAGLSFEPTEYVDISAVWDKKEAMLRCHATQLGASAQHGDRDLVALARDLARFRGHQCGVEFAESFRPCMKWKRLRPFRLLP